MLERFYRQRSYVSEEIGKGPFMPSKDELESGNMEEIAIRKARMIVAYKNLLNLRRNMSDEPEK